MSVVEEDREHPSPVLAASGLGAELRAARKARRLSLAEVGRAVGRSAPTISHWESDRHAPDAYQLAAWARALGFELCLYEPVTNSALPQETAALLDELIDVLARALLEDGDEEPAESTPNAQGAA